MPFRFDKLTQKAQEAVQEAQEIAGQNGHQAVHPLHLLIALGREREGIVRPVLEKCGVQPDPLIAEAERQLAAIPKVTGQQTGMYISPALNQVLEAAFKEAGNFKDEYVSAEHILLAIATIVGTLAIARWAGELTERKRIDGRTAVALTAVSDGVHEAVHLIREHDPRLLGSVAYWLFDNLALFACLAAFGPAPSFWAVAMAYLVGMLGNSIPIPGGFIAVEGGLFGMLLLFGVHPAGEALAAVVTFRAIQLWIPAVIGTLAFVGLRREIGKPLAPATPG